MKIRRNYSIRLSESYITTIFHPFTVLRRLKAGNFQSFQLTLHNHDIFFISRLELTNHVNYFLHKKRPIYVVAPVKPYSENLK